MSTTGVVREWHSDDGWGVIDSPAVPKDEPGEEGPPAAYGSALRITRDPQA